MRAKSQLKATSADRRAAARRLVRVEVEAAKSVAGLIRALAQMLRAKSERARALRAIIETALHGSDVETAFDVFGSDLPEETFAGVFDQERPRSSREIDL